MSVEGGKNDILVIEALRGIAALMVVYSHFSDFQFSKAAAYLDTGKLGVVIFFFVSGFLILRSAGTKSTRSFVISRFFRLYPLYWLSILLAVTVGGATVTTPQLLANLTMFQQFVGIENVISVYWTLTIELFFYCVVAALAIALRARLMNYLGIYVLGAAAFAIALSLIKAAYWANAPVALGLGLTTMFLGAVFRQHDFDLRRSLPHILIYLVTVVFAGIVGYGQQAGEEPIRYISSYVIALGVFWCAGKYRAHYRFRFTFFGEYSYGVYLFHLPLFYAIPGLTHSLQGFLIVSVVSIAFSFVVNKVIEQPAITFGRKLDRMLGRAA
ncbi:acyltransferase family protein [Tistrella mobilis]